MVTELTDRVIEILRGCPYGLTAKEVADRLGGGRSKANATTAIKSTLTPIPPAIRSVFSPRSPVPALAGIGR